MSDYKLFTFADYVDYLLMLAGSISAAGNGISQPLMIIIVRQLMDSFGKNVNTRELIHAVSQVISTMDQDNFNCALEILHDHL